MKSLNDKILYMCFEDFTNPDAIIKLDIFTQCVGVEQNTENKIMAQRSYQ